jgi:Uma2 family endonuclease
LPDVSGRDDGSVAARTAFEPAALVVCPAPADLNTLEIPNPVIVVEVLSPSTAADDHGVKLDGYFSLGSVNHYLILDPDRRVMIHHRRAHAGAIETRVLREGQSDPRPTRLRRPGGGLFRN